MTCLYAVSVPVYIEFTGLYSGDLDLANAKNNTIKVSAPRKYSRPSRSLISIVAGALTFQTTSIMNIF